MTRGLPPGRQRVRTARSRSAQSTRWLERQLNDPYVKRARAEGYRSRAAYKLIELDERFKLLRGVKRDDVERGQVLCKPGSITPHTKFAAETYVLTKEEGGRHTPFFNGYRPQFYFRTTDVTGVAHLPEGVEMVMPGDNVAMEIELIAPIAMEKGLRFAIREGGRTVGAGTVSEVVE